MNLEQAKEFTTLCKLLKIENSGDLNKFEKNKKLIKPTAKVLIEELRKELYICYEELGEHLDNCDNLLKKCYKRNEELEEQNRAKSEELEMYKKAWKQLKWVCDKLEPKGAEK